MGWSQVDLSVVSRINESHISKIENGRTGPNLQTIRAFGIALGKKPQELLEFEFDLRLNTNFALKGRKVKGPRTTSFVKKLVADGFFKRPKYVADVILQTKKDFNVTLLSDDTSGALLRLVEDGILKTRPSSIKGRSLYQNA
jgi:transcriptional regulator with XRE-family HTH domain